MSQEATGTRDKHYNLVSVLYHALQGGDTLDQYIQDAQDDADLAQFLQETQQQYKQVAERAKQLLGQRLG